MEEGRKEGKKRKEKEMAVLLSFSYWINYGSDLEHFAGNGGGYL